MQYLSFMVMQIKLIVVVVLFSICSFHFWHFLFSVRAYNLNFFVVKFCQVTPAANGLFEINYGVVSFGELCCTAL